jgi:hypothetical protein
MTLTTPTIPYTGDSLARLVAAVAEQKRMQALGSILKACFLLVLTLRPLQLLHQLLQFLRDGLTDDLVILQSEHLSEPSQKKTRSILAENSRDCGDVYRSSMQGEHTRVFWVPSGRHKLEGRAALKLWGGS